MIVFIESNTSGTGEYYYKLCKKKKLEFIFLVRKPKKYSWLEKKYYKVINTDDVSKIFKYLRNLNKTSKIKFILSTSDNYILTSNKLNKLMKISYENLKNFEVLKNKFKCLNKMKKYNLVNRYYFLYSQKKINSINYPCIVKPNSGTGSINVYKIYNKDQLIKKINLIKKSKVNDILVDEFVKGEEYSLEILFFNKKIIFSQIIKKFINDTEHFVESGHLISPDNQNHLKYIENKILKKIKKFNFNLTFLHIEFKIDKNLDIQIIEINPRLAGGFIPILIKYCFKIDLINFYLDLIFKKNSHIKKIKNTNFYKIFFLIPNKSKKIKKVSMVNSINDLILEKKIYRDKLKSFSKIMYNFQDRIGHVILKSRTIKKLSKKESFIKSKIKYIYEQ